MKRLFLFFLVFAFGFTGFSQKNTKPTFGQTDQLVSPLLTKSTLSKDFSLYEFRDSSVSFSSIHSTGIAVTPTDWDDGYYYLDLTGEFAFFYNGRYITSFSLGTNGGVMLGVENEVGYTNDLTRTSSAPTIAPLWDDMKFYLEGSGDGLFYQLDQENGQKVLTIEWYRITHYSREYDTVTFQTKLYQDGTIEFIYGNMSKASNWSASASIGCNDLQDNNLEFISITPGSPPSVSRTTANNSISASQLAGIPEGTVYKLIPLYADYDLAAQSVLPLYGALDSLSFTLKIKNVGKDTIQDTILLRLEVNDSTGNVFSYVDTVGATFIPGESYEYVTEPWLPQHAGSYEATFVVEYPDDQNRDNDTLRINLQIYDKIVNMHNGVDTICTGLFFDSGGPDGNYSDRLYITNTFYPKVPGAKLKITFQSFQLENGYDYLYIYDGENSDAPLLAKLTGSSLPSPITATNYKGALTFVFSSDGSMNYAGWRAEFSCIMPPDHDLAVHKLGPEYYFPGEQMIPELVLRNYGGNKEAGFQVHVWDSLGTYDQTITVTDSFAPVTELELQFPGWQPTTDTNVLYAAVVLDSDENHSNDTLAVRFYKFVTIYSWSISETEGVYPGAVRVNRIAKQFLQLNRYSDDFLAAGDITPWGWIGLTYNSSRLLSLDTLVFNMYFLTDTLPLYQPTALTYNPKNGYIYLVGFSLSDDSSRLYRFDPATCHLDSIGKIDEEIVIGVAADTNGQLYGIGVFHDNFFSIDTTTGKATVIGPVGVNLNYAQDIGFDRKTNTLYGTLYGDDPGLYKFDLSTGTASLIYAFDSHLSCVAVPYQYPFSHLLVNVVNPFNRGISDVSVELNALGKEQATMTTNDNGNALLIVPQGRYLLKLKWRDSLLYQKPIFLKTDTNITVVLGQFNQITFDVINDDGMAVDSANVVVMAGSDTVANGYTDENGMFTTNLLTGTYSLTVSKPAYATYNTTIIVDTNDTLYVVLALTNLQAENADVRIYPNPTSDNLTIVGAKGAELRLYSLSGKTIMQKHLDRDVYLLNVKGLKPGAYLVSIRRNGKVYNFRVLKR